MDYYHSVLIAGCSKDESLPAVTTDDIRNNRNRVLYVEEQLVRTEVMTLPHVVYVGVNTKILLFPIVLLQTELVTAVLPSIHGLTENTTYYVRACNEQCRTTYGEQKFLQQLKL